jgi:hypothetical protein
MSFPIPFIDRRKLRRTGGATDNDIPIIPMHPQARSGSACTRDKDSYGSSSAVRAPGYAWR